MLRPSLAWTAALLLCGCSLTVSLDGLTERDGDSGHGGLAGGQGLAGAPVAGRGGAGVGGTGGTGVAGAASGGGGAAGESASVGGSSAAGTGGEGGTAGGPPSVIELDGCVNTSPGGVSAGMDVPIVSFGVSSAGYAYAFIDNSVNGARLWPGFGVGTSESGNMTLPAGILGTRLRLVNEWVFGTADDGKTGRLFGFSFGGSRPCNGSSGQIAALTQFTSCDLSATTTAVAIASNTVVVGTTCGEQHVADLTRCPGDSPEVNVVSPGMTGYATALYALALDGPATLYSLERTTASGPLAVVRKGVDLALADRFASATTLATFGPSESGSELVLSGSTLHTMVQEESSASSLVASYDLTKPTVTRTVLASPHRQAEQLAVMGTTVYWVEQTIGNAEIWRQTSTTRQRLVCLTSRIANLTVIKEGVFWHDRDKAPGPMIYRVDL